ncbi:MAG: discoidin domain-containing protein [Nitrospiraceae bacterium]|nr:MAG: discoidin domain-containing protein [Nitrospiraceae bacterium]
MISPSDQGKPNPAIYIIIIILPFLLFYWMVPFVTGLTIGNDYDEYSIQNQMELLFALKTGSFPLYVPGYALGHSSSALTLGQVFHPISHIASFLPGYWDGKALQWNTFLRLLSLGLVHLALFSFLRRIQLNTLFSFLLSCITVYNLRMLDMFRFAASLEAYTGFLLLCTVLGWYFLEPSKRILPFGIIGATYLLICSGHPTMMFYCLIGAGLFLLVIPFFLSNMLHHKRVSYKDAFIFYFKAGCYMILGILLSSAYIIPFYFDFYKMNILRVTQAFDYETLDTFFGTLSNFFMPLFSDVNGAFGGSHLFIAAAILPLLRCFKVKIPFSVWIIWGLVLLAFLFLQESRTPVYKWAWDYVPFVSSLRTAGRISIFIPVLFMLLLAWIVSAKPFSLQLGNRSVTLTPLLLLTFISLLLLSLYAALSVTIRPALGMFPPKGIRNIPLSVIIILTLFGAASLISLIAYSAFPHKARIIGIVLSLTVCLHLGGLLRYGIWIAENRDQPSFQQMKSQKKTNLNYLYPPGNGMYSSVILTQLEHSFIEPYLGKIFTEAIPVSTQNEAYRIMKHERLPQQVFVEGFETETAKSLNENARSMREGRVNLVYNSFNRLQFKVYSETPAILGLSYPFTGQWEAWVSNKQAAVYRSNGAAHAVIIPGGESLVEFRYWSSAAFWGIVISCITFILIGLSASLLYLNGLQKITAAIVVLIVGVGSVILWHHSLYSGDNLGTKFSWSYTPPAPAQKPNLAYGKTASAFPMPNLNVFAGALYGGTFHRTHCSKVVDGDRSSGFEMKLVDNPFVIIDLNQTEKINSIILFESMKEPSSSSGQLELSISQDEKQWNKVALISSTAHNHYPFRIEFDSEKTARFIQIRASGHGYLNLDEVEVY